MRKKITRFPIIFLLFITAAALSSTTGAITICTENIEFATNADPQVVYIYDTDLDTANDFKNLLELNNYSVTLLNITNINSSSELTQYKLIIVGDDFQHYTVNIISAIDDSVRPIIGFGMGGTTFFENLSLAMVDTIFYSLGSNSVNATNSSHPVFNIPCPIPTTGSITLYTTAPFKGGAVETEITSPSSDIELIGRNPEIFNYYTIVAQENRYILWGFWLGPMNMSSTGKDLFINIVEYYYFTQSDGKSPIPSFELLFILITLPAIIIGIRKINPYRICDS